MITVLAILLGASVANCVPVPGADRLWRPSIRWTIVGELHGTNEAPDAFVNLVCLASATGRPVTVAVEYSADSQPVIDTYLASRGDGPAQAALLRLQPFTSEMQDGRGSVAFLHMWDRLRRMKQAGQINGVIASDVSRSSAPGQDRDAAMAQTWASIPTADDGIILILVGNVHAMRKPMSFLGRTIVTAGSLMPASRTITINVTGSGGTAWNCQADGCKSHNNGPPLHVKTGISYLTDVNRSWDAEYQLGRPTTAAFPAITNNNLSSSVKMRINGSSQ